MWWTTVRHLPYKVDLINSVKIILWKQWDDLFTGNDTRWVLNRSWGRTWTHTHLLTPDKLKTNISKTGSVADLSYSTDVSLDEDLYKYKWRKNRITSAIGATVGGLLEHPCSHLQPICTYMYTRKSNFCVSPITEIACGHHRNWHREQLGYAIWACVIFGLHLKQMFNHAKKELNRWL